MKEETSMEKKICRKLKRVLNTLSDLRVGLLKKKAGYESSRPSVQAWSGIDGTVEGAAKGSIKLKATSIRKYK